MLRTLDGYLFDPDEDVWHIPTLGGLASFNFDNLPGASSCLRQCIKDVCAALLVSIAPLRANQALWAYRALLRHSAAQRCLDSIALDDVVRYGESLGARQRYRLRQIKEHLLLWINLGIAGLDADLCSALPYLVTQTHEIGNAVRTMDVNIGPLTDIEYESVTTAMRREFAAGRVGRSDYTLMTLALTLGVRPSQIAAMKCKDFSETYRQDGSRIFILQVTRLKQGKGIRPRTLFRPRELSGSLGVLVQAQYKTAADWAQKYGIPVDEAPIFPSPQFSRARSMADIGLFGHFTGRGIGEKLRRLFQELQVISHRTGKCLEVPPIRLRRTLGTRAAAEGCPASVIADLLDHSWVDSSLIYIETRPAIIERIDKALSLQIAPLAQAFAGILTPRNDSGTGRVIPHVTAVAFDSIGRCGKHDFCRLAAPLACYTCAYFHPWIDAPHEALLDSLLSEREALAASADLRVAAVNDLTILAVADVVRRCREANQRGAA
jgi:integrase